MDRSSRRERLGLVAIAIAALASAATSPLPTPSPDLSETRKGSIHLTAEAPIAWLDFRANENEALTTLGGTTAVSFSAEAQGVGVALFDWDVRFHRASGGATSVRGVGHCYDAPDDCQPTVRLVAVLVDPAAHPEADVAWTATAESRFPKDTAPVPDAKLALEVGRVESRPPEALGLTSTVPETIELGPDVPRTLRKVRITLPAGPAQDPIFEAGLLLRTTDLHGGPAYNPPVSLRVGQREDLLGKASWASELMTPFGDCEPASPCEFDLLIEFNWNGGSAEGSAIEWSLAAWPGLSAGEPVPPAAIAVSELADGRWDRPDLRDSLIGQTDVSGRVGNPLLNAVLDINGVPPAAGEVEGLVRFTFRASLPPDADPGTEISVSLGDGLGVQKLRPGGTVVVYSLAKQLECDGRSACGAFSSFRLQRESDDPAATVTWTADVEYLSPTGVVPDGLRLLLQAQPQTR